MKNPILPLLLSASSICAADLPEANFQPQTIDGELSIGYGVAISDVDGDGFPDIVLADSRETRWYRNPGGKREKTWEKHVLTGSLTKNDHVCVAACDTDGDGKAEIAVGAEWNPGDTRDSGAVFTLAAQEDRASSWEATEQHREPTVHRMHWVKESSSHFLAVLPLHGCGNENGEGEGIRFLGYRKSASPNEKWNTFLIHHGFHLAHNFQPVSWNAGDTNQSMLVAEKKGVHLIEGSANSWESKQLTHHGSGEVQLGRLPDGRRFIATIEPMHGNQVVIYPEIDTTFTQRLLVDDTLSQGHALVAGDFLGVGHDQIAAGWRSPGKDGKVGLRLYAPSDKDGQTWKLHATIDDNQMACEDMKAGDLDGDGKLDLIAAGRSTKNLTIYWNLTMHPESK